MKPDMLTRRQEMGAWLILTGVLVVAVLVIIGAWPPIGFIPGMGIGYGISAMMFPPHTSRWWF